MRKTVLGLGPAFVAISALIALATPAAAAPDFTHLQWDMIDIRAPRARTVATGAGVVVAVIDTGIDIDHPEFEGRIVSPASFIDCPGDVTPCEGLEFVDDDNGHGTHVSGTIAAADDGEGITGIAPDAEIMPIKVFDASGSGGIGFGAAVDYAVAHGADVISMSFGYLAGTGIPLGLLGLDDGWAAATDRAYRAGVLPVIAAGNESLPVCGNLQTLRDTGLCVGAYGRTEAYYTNWGLGVDIIAPGGDGVNGCGGGGILSTYRLDAERCGPETGYGYLSGTSMATPHVAGVAALLVEQGLSATSARARILTTARGRGTLAVLLGLAGPKLDAAAAVGA